jgi:integrase
MARPRLPISTYGTINVRELEPGVWRARTLYRFPDGKRRQVERIRPGRTGAKASTALLEALVHLATPMNGELTASTKLSVLGHRFLAEKRDSGLSVGSLATYEQVIRSIIVPRIGDLRLDEATPGRLQPFFTAIAREHGHGQAKTCRSVLSGMLGMAVRVDAIRTNPVSQVAQIRHRQSHASTALLLEAVPGFIDAVRSDAVLRQLDVGDLLAFMVLTGCRIGEALGLLWTNVDFAAGKVTFDGTAVRVPGGGVVNQRHGKTAASTRTISVPPRTLRIVEARERNADVVFPSVHMRVRDPVNVENIWRQNRGRLGFEDVTTHALRKTAATGLDVAGMSARGIAEYLGHAKPSLTQDVYMSRNVGSAEAAQHLERMFGISSESLSGPNS